MTPGRTEGQSESGNSRSPSADAPHLANRVVQAGIGAALLAGVRRRDPIVVVNGVVSFAFAALPRFAESRYGVRVQPWQRLWVSVAALVHALGMLGPYDRVWWWDHLAHTLSGAVVAGATDVVLRAETGDGGPGPNGGRFRPAVVAGTTLAFGVFWELLEYAIHAAANRLGFDPLLVHYGRLDALADLLFDLVGAGLVIRFGRRALRVRDSTPADDSA